ncbi:hypothetical protein [Streptomyces sp. NPDC048516]|uniref:hypothetical protein n=1 Tax=Streptomyces sp. NPDC048516 TaxID=3365565 RepID=UPI0037104961
MTRSDGRARCQARQLGTFQEPEAVGPAGNRVGDQVVGAAGEGDDLGIEVAMIFIMSAVLQRGR